MSDNDPSTPNSDPAPEPTGSAGHEHGPAAAPQPTVLPSGANVDAEAVDAQAADPDAPKKLSRRGLLTGIGIGAAVIAAGGFTTWSFVSNRSTTTANGLEVTDSWAGREIALTAPSGVCEAPLVIAYEKGFFADAGLNVTLKKTGDGENLVEAVGSGKYAASNGIFFNYLGPIYNVTPVRLSGGLHHCCLDLYVGADSGIDAVGDLKGRRIGVSSLQGSATNFFSLDLLDAGINSSPDAKQVEWVVIEQDLLPKALQDGDVDAIATSGGFLPIIRGVEEGWAKVLSNNNDISPNADQPCCAVVLNTDFVSQDPVTAAALVNAWAEGSRYAGAHLEETAQLEAEKNYVSGTTEEIIPVLETLTFDPSPNNLRDSLLPGIEKYIDTGFLPADTDAQQLADKAFVDLGLNF